MEKAIIHLDGKDYHILPGDNNQEKTYMVQIDTHEVTFRPDDQGKLQASHDHIPNEFLSRLAQKIESYFF
ncbi:hypothetical protein [Chitinophaga arvensicola]|uniref:Uncharacterized protein n=1 Tax=Chitinophaga arvensicola TaxID=29529 RepID=A0A1I0SA50_9BACT|nr:hypothetical protein [Chitinophaga arvensicola]SEW52961.1 hypothetical protein SAMN04488122_5263 [Chitinophaga arvensicola]